MKKFDQVEAEIYEMAIRKKVPSYEVMHTLIGLIVQNMPIYLENILVIGAGTGEELSRLIKFNDTLIIDAVEPSSDMASKLLEKIFSENAINRVRLITKNLSDAENLENYQIITSILVSHFVSYDFKMDFFRKISSHLDERGLVFVVDAFLNGERSADLNYRSWINFLRLNGFSKEKIEFIEDNFSTKFYPISVENFKTIVKDSGLEIVDEFWQSLIFRGFV